MFTVFQGPTADSVWCEIAEAFRSGEGTTQPSRAGETREILHSAMSISNPRQRWVTSRVPTINIAFALAEVVWILNGRNDSKFLNYFNRQLPKFAGHATTYHGAYGRRLRSHLGMDQLQRAYEALHNKPSSRQVVLQIWDSRIDLPRSSGKEASSDVPCNVASILKVRDGKLHWMQIMRSNDVYMGLPYNIVQFTTLQEVIAGWLELELGEYNQISNSLHVYLRDLERVYKPETKPVPVNTDSLAFPKSDSEHYFAELAANVENLVDNRRGVEPIFSTLDSSRLPSPFKNVLSILTAEAARRREQEDLVVAALSHCHNPIYRHLYERWLSRCYPSKLLLKSTARAFAS
jgi:thymidylate synthase